jgi:hypothetical protein
MLKAWSISGIVRRLSSEARKNMKSPSGSLFYASRQAFIYPDPRWLPPRVLLGIDSVPYFIIRLAKGSLHN